MGDKLKQTRLAAGLTQKQLAELIGCSQQHIARWEAGREPGALTLKKIAVALRCSMDDLV